MTRKMVRNGVMTAGSAAMHWVQGRVWSLQPRDNRTRGAILVLAACERAADDGPPSVLAIVVAGSAVEYFAHELALGLFVANR